MQLWPTAEYERVARDALAGLNPLGPEARSLKRHLYGNAVATELDAAGRIMVPPKLLGYAGLSKDVVMVGAGECLEVWDSATWDVYDAQLTAEAADHIANIGHPA